MKINPKQKPKYVAIEEHFKRQEDEIDHEARQILMQRKRMSQPITLAEIEEHRQRQDQIQEELR